MRLSAAARRGVAVRVLIDGLGGRSLSAKFLRELADENVEVVFFRPFGDLKNWRRWHRRDHRKVIVVDGRVAFTGGLNLSDEYAPREQKGKGWRDTHAQVEGPVVAELDRSFRDLFIRCGGKQFSLCPKESIEVVGGDDREAAAVAMSDKRARGIAIRKRLLHAMKQARKTICIANAYFVPDRLTRRELIRAARRGVRVELILPAKCDIRWVQWAGEHLYEALLEGGVRIYLWTDSHMHAKTAVIDETWSTIGSYNIDYLSLFTNLEVVLEVLGEKTGRRMQQIFECDRKRASELSLPEWRKRPWRQRLRSWFAFRLRRWF